MSDGDRVESNLGELDRNINDTLVFSRTVLDKFVKLKNGFRAVPMNEDSETNKEEALDNKILISNRNVKRHKTKFNRYRNSNILF